MKLVSVIVAAYNVGQYIEKCLISIKEQTYGNFEVIVVDDESTDNTPKICDDFIVSDDRFSVVHKKNEGAGYARNTGLEHAKGEFILFVDGDDFLEPNMIEMLLSYQEDTNSDMVICGFRRYIDENHIKNVCKVKEMTLYEGKEAIIKKVLCPILGNDASKTSNDGREMCLWTNLYNRKIIEQYGIRLVSEREYLSEDLFFNIDYLKNCERVTMIPECLYNYRFNPVSLTNGYRANRIDLLNNLMTIAVPLLEKEGISKYSSKRLQRMYFMKLRNSLLQVTASKMSLSEKKDITKKAINSEQCIKAISDYPIGAVKLTDSIMLKLIKQRNVPILLGYMNLQRHMLMLRNSIRKI